MTEQELFNAQEEELLIEIGKAILPSSLNALPRSRREILELSNRWVSVQTDKCRHLVCSNATIKELSDDGFSSQLVAALIALLETITIGTATTPLAILLCRRGIKHLCKDEWRQDEGSTEVESENIIQ